MSSGLQLERCCKTRPVTEGEAPEKPKTKGSAETTGDVAGERIPSSSAESVSDATQSTQSGEPTKTIADIRRDWRRAVRRNVVTVVAFGIMAYLGLSWATANGELSADDAGWDVILERMLDPSLGLRSDDVLVVATALLVVTVSVAIALAATRRVTDDQWQSVTGHSWAEVMARISQVAAMGTVILAMTRFPDLNATSTGVSWVAEASVAWGLAALAVAVSAVTVEREDDVVPLLLAQHDLRSRRERVVNSLPGKRRQAKPPGWELAAAAFVGLCVILAYSVVTAVVFAASAAAIDPRPTWAVAFQDAAAAGPLVASSLSALLWAIFGGWAMVLWQTSDVGIERWSGLVILLLPGVFTVGLVSGAVGLDEPPAFRVLLTALVVLATAGAILLARVGVRGRGPLFFWHLVRVRGLVSELGRIDRRLARVGDALSVSEHRLRGIQPTDWT